MRSEDIATSHGEAGINVLELAKALGLKTEHLCTFQLTADNSNIIRLEAGYYCTNGDIERAVRYVQATA